MTNVQKYIQWGGKPCKNGVGFEKLFSKDCYWLETNGLTRLLVELFLLAESEPTRISNGFLRAVVGKVLKTCINDGFVPACEIEVTRSAFD